MWRHAIPRGLITGGIPAALGLGKLADSQNGGSNEVALLIAAISGVTAIVTTLLIVVGPWYLRRLSSRDPDSLEARTEATDALAEALVHANREKERLEAKLKALDDGA
jgi:hypothetical protein